MTIPHPAPPPILEFDPAPEAVIEPGAVIARRDVPALGLGQLR